MLLQLLKLTTVTARVETVMCLLTDMLDGSLLALYVASWYFVYRLCVIECMFA